MTMGILKAALTFFGTKMVQFFQILTTDITTYKGGAIWTAIGTIYDAILAMGITIAGILIWFGLLSSTSRYAELKKATVWGQFLVEIVLTNAILYYGKNLLLYAVQIGQGMARSVLTTTGLLTVATEPVTDPFLGNVIIPEGTEIYKSSLGMENTVSSGLLKAVDNLSLSKGILLFIVVLIGAVFIVVATLGVLLTVYGRLFNLYIMIAISPIPIATAIGKPTRFVFFNFIKSFLAVVLEALVIVLVLFVFTKFIAFEPKINKYDSYIDPAKYKGTIMTGGATGLASSATGLLDLDSIPDSEIEQTLQNLRNQYPDGKVPIIQSDGTTFVDIPGSAQEFRSNVDSYQEMSEDLDGTVFSYIAEMAFLFLMLFGMLKGTDKLVHRIFGI